jgi:hypothetical protein
MSLLSSHAVHAIALLLWLPAFALGQPHVIDQSVTRAKAVLASSLDRTLPAIPVEPWLRQLLGADRAYVWLPESCDGTRTPGPSEYPRPMCAVLVAWGSAETVGIVIWVGDLLSRAGEVRWGVPQFEEGWIDRHLEDRGPRSRRQAVLLGQLGALPGRWQQPTNAWPQPDLAVSDDMRCATKPAPPGFLQVTCETTVRNIGAAPTEARIYASSVEACSDMGAGSEMPGVRMPAGAQEAIRHTWRLPAGRAWIVSLSVESLDRGGYGGRRTMIRDANPENNRPLSRGFGQPPPASCIGRVRK